MAFVNALLRFFDGATARDVGITKDSFNNYRLHTRSASELTHIEANDAVNVIINDVETMYSTLFYPADGWIYGFNAWGETDGIYILKKNSVELARLQSNATNNSVLFILPVPFPILNGDSLELSVTNCGVQTATYKGSIYSEVKT